MNDHCEFCPNEGYLQLVVVYLDAIARGLVKTGHPDLHFLLRQILEEYQLDVSDLDAPTVFESHLAEMHEAFTKLVLRHEHRPDEMPPS